MVTSFTFTRIFTFLYYFLGGVSLFYNIYYSTYKRDLFIILRAQQSINPETYHTYGLLNRIIFVFDVVNICEVNVLYIIYMYYSETYRTNGKCNELCVIII